MFKYFGKLISFSAVALIVIAEKSINTMCVLHLDEIELPKELENRDF